MRIRSRGPDGPLLSVGACARASVASGGGLRRHPEHPHEGVVVALGVDLGSEAPGGRCRLVALLVGSAEHERPQRYERIGAEFVSDPVGPPR